MKITGAVRKIIRKEIITLVNKGYSKEEVAKMYGMTRANVYNIVQKEKDNCTMLDN